MDNGLFDPDSIVGTQSGGKRFAVPRDSVVFVEARDVSASQSFKALGWVAMGLLSALTLVLVSAMSEFN